MEISILYHIIVNSQLFAFKEVASSLLSSTLHHDCMLNQKFPLSLVFALSKSIKWSLFHECFVLLDTLLHCFYILHVIQPKIKVLITTSN